MHASPRPFARAVLATTLALVLLAPADVGLAGSTPATGRYRGTTGDGHVIEFTVARSAKPGFARKITHFHVVYDIAGCRSGPVRQVFFASVRTGGLSSSRGTFSRTVGQTGKANEVQLRLTGRFRALAARKNVKSVVAAAVARELAGFLWAEMTAD